MNSTVYERRFESHTHTYIWTMFDPKAAIESRDILESLQNLRLKTVEDPDTEGISSHGRTAKACAPSGCIC